MWVNDRIGPMTRIVGWMAARLSRSEINADKIIRNTRGVYGFFTLVP